MRSVDCYCKLAVAAALSYGAKTLFELFVDGC